MESFKTKPQLLSAVSQLQNVFDYEVTVQDVTLLENKSKDLSIDKLNLQAVSNQIERRLIVYYLNYNYTNMKVETKLIIKTTEDNEKAPFFLFFTAGGERVYPLIPIIVDLSRANNDFAPGK